MVDAQAMLQERQQRACRVADSGESCVTLGTMCCKESTREMPATVNAWAASCTQRSLFRARAVARPWLRAYRYSGRRYVRPVRQARYHENATIYA